MANFYIEHNWILGQFPATFQHELFSARTYVLAPAMISHTAQVTPEPGGFRLNGRWPWGTGIIHAEWVIPAATEHVPDGKPMPRWLALPVSEMRIEDTWYVDGMIGTGSNDVVLEDVFIPQERSVSMIDLSHGRGPGSTLHASPLYRTPMLPVLILETTAFFALHRHYDPYPTALDDAIAEETVVDALVNAYARCKM